MLFEDFQSELMDYQMDIVARHLNSFTYNLSFSFENTNYPFITMIGPGSGKGLLSERLVKECGVVHLSSGDLLRAEVEADTPLGRHVDEIMKR